jgi:hypothetical protein
MLDSLFGGSESTTNPATVWGPQEQYLKNLYYPTQQLMQQQMGSAPGMAKAYSQDLYGQGQQFSQDLMGISSGSNPFMQSLYGFGSGAQTAAAVDALGANVGRQLEQEILPALGSDAVFAGTYGQDRYQISAGMAAQGDTGGDVRAAESE